MRGWTEFVAALGDHIPLGVLTLLLIVLAGLTGAALYWWPRWLPGRWWRRLVPAGGPRRWRLRWPRWTWRRRRRPVTDMITPAADPAHPDELPDLPTEAFVSRADQLAAQGRYAEAVRERLRGMVRELVDAGAAENQPGWTVTELAGAAGATRPLVRDPLAAASRVFSDIWYGQRPAGAAHDQQMRVYAGTVHAALRPVAAARDTGGSR